ncbi:MAG TPA: GntG family PLP-dependent aldolase [Candidatus Angelobacter sp.]|nr:GntG family PLP-dependent aldolase [Candidatus Angelobacter sp.]
MYESADLKATAASVIDLRSDTVTKPSPAMRQAMFEAEVGDDVYAEDPTINRLERRAAEVFGREAALFVPSGTMGNQIAIKLHTTHGQEVICEERGHVFDYEMAMMAHFSGVLARTVRAGDGIVTWQHIASKLRGKSYHSAKTGLVSLENTHNIAGGVVTPLDVFDEVCDCTHEAGLPVHLDGARVFNASVALGVPVDRLTAKADTVMFCLSKGLGAPVGSLLLGTADAIDRGRIYRKALGGGMRQAGILAAAGLIALEEGPKKLATDHANAKFLAEGLAQLPGFKIDSAKVQTNILICDITGTGMTSDELSQRLAESRVLANGVSPLLIRFVTHLDVSREQCARALEVVASLCGVKKALA